MHAGHVCPVRSPAQHWNPARKWRHAHVLDHADRHRTNRIIAFRRFARPTAQAILYPANELAAFDVHHVVSDLTLPGHIKLLTNILTTWRSTFRLSRNQTFASLVRDLTLALTPEPREAQYCGEPVQGHHLLETAVDPMLGEVSAIYGVTAGSVMVIPPRFVAGKQTRNAWQPCHLLVEAPQDLPSSCY